MDEIGLTVEQREIELISRKRKWKMGKAKMKRDRIIGLSEKMKQMITCSDEVTCERWRGGTHVFMFPRFFLT
jgi:hypothetical protein